MNHAKLIEEEGVVEGEDGGEVSVESKGRRCRDHCTRSYGDAVPWMGVAPVLPPQPGCQLPDVRKTNHHVRIL